MSLKAGLGGDLINFVIWTIAFFIIGYFVAYFMIKKFNYLLLAEWETISQKRMMNKVRPAAVAPKAETASRSGLSPCWGTG